MHSDVLDTVPLVHSQILVELTRFQTVYGFVYPQLCPECSSLKNSVQQFFRLIRISTNLICKADD